MSMPSTSLSETVRSTDLSVSLAEATADFWCVMVVLKAARGRMLDLVAWVATRRAIRAVLEVRDAILMVCCCGCDLSV